VPAWRIYAAGDVTHTVLVRNHHFLREIMKSVPNFLFFYEKKSKTDIVFLKRNRNLTYLINRAVANCLVRGLKINTKGEFYYGI
jgi:hypothetical protein